MKKYQVKISMPAGLGKVEVCADFTCRESLKQFYQGLTEFGARVDFCVKMVA